MISIDQMPPYEAKTGRYQLYDQRGEKVGLTVRTSTTANIPRQAELPLEATDDRGKRTEACFWPPHTWPSRYKEQGAVEGAIIRPLMLHGRSRTLTMLD